MVLHKVSNIIKPEYAEPEGWKLKLPSKDVMVLILQYHTLPIRACHPKITPWFKLPELLLSNEKFIFQQAKVLLFTIHQLEATLL